MSAETCTVRFLLNAIDALEDAKDETGIGFVGDYCEKRDHGDQEGDRSCDGEGLLND